MDVLKHNVIARFTFRQMRQAIFKLNKGRIGSSAGALKVRSLDALTRRAVRGMTITKSMCTTNYTQGDAGICVADMPITVEQATTACDL